MTRTLLAIHGRYAGALEFDRCKAFFPEQIDFQAFDLPGFGVLNEINRKIKPFDYANFLHRRSNKLSKPMFLLGVDTGCLIALEYAQHYPNEIAGLILHSFPFDLISGNILESLIKSVSGEGKRFAFINVLDDYTQRFQHNYQQSNPSRKQIERLFNNQWFSSLPSVQAIETAYLNGSGNRPFTQKEEDSLKKVTSKYSTVIIPNWKAFPAIETPGDFAQEVTALIEQMNSPLHRF